MDEHTATPAPRSGGQPRIAVIVPCYNDAGTLPETLASLHGAEPLEVVVVDDASTDPATIELLERLGRDDSSIRVIRRTENGDVSAARMTGVAETTAPFVFPLDADDLAVPETLTRMADRLEAAPGAAACIGDYEEFGDHEVRRSVPDSLDPFRVAYVNEYPVASMFRRSTLEQVGGWRTGAGYEDWDLWMTLAQAGLDVVHAGHDVVSFRRRTHGSRMLADRKGRHVAVYRDMRDHHPELFRRLREHRRTTTLSPLRRRLYPLLYGGRRRFRAEVWLRRTLDRFGVWALGR
jgi:glycosyltransferase involved in cell wall biosynthesis